MATSSITEVRKRLNSLLDRVEAGEAITVTRRGRPVVRIVPIEHTAPRADAQDIVEAFRKIRHAVAKRGGMQGASVRDLVRAGRRTGR